jgi:hypothetical protein
MHEGLSNRVDTINEDYYNGPKDAHEYESNSDDHDGGNFCPDWYDYTCTGENDEGNKNFPRKLQPSPKKQKTLFVDLSDMKILPS